MQQRVFIDQYEQKRFYLVCCYSRFIPALVDLEIRIFLNNLPNVSNQWRTPYEVDKFTCL